MYMYDNNFELSVSKRSRIYTHILDTAGIYSYIALDNAVLKVSKKRALTNRRRSILMTISYGNT